MDAAQEVKSRLDVADVLGEYLHLKPAGSGSFKALCPFHREKTPSFYINRPRQSWHCFGCDIGGDVISFVMQMEGMEFPEALQHLATKAGIELPQYKPENVGKKKRIYEVNDSAVKYFASQLRDVSASEFARTYLKNRGVDELTTDQWKLGYASDSWDTFSKALLAKQFLAKELVDAGLCGMRENGTLYDRFRNRIMIPIRDVHGNTIGFTGRYLGTDVKEAKYVNTPETDVFKKSAVLYGLDVAKSSIKREDLAVIVEGNMDVVTSHQAGIENVVCSSGTALTAEQLGLIKRFTSNIAIAFDADAAGNAATLRGLDLARSQDLNIRVITIPSDIAKDPDELVRKDPELWKKAIAQAIPIVDWIYQNGFRQGTLATPEGKKKIAASILPELIRISNPIERDAWVERLAKDLSVSSEALREAIRKTPAPKTTGSSMPNVPRVTNEPKITKKDEKTRYVDLADRIASILYLNPSLEELAKQRCFTYPLPVPRDTEHLNYLAVFADREFPDQSPTVLQKELEESCVQYVELIRSGDLQHLEQEMREAEASGDQNRIADLLHRFSSHRP